MIAGDGRVIKICIHCNEVGTNTCHWLPIIHHNTEVGFALNTEEGLLFFFFGLGSERRSAEEEKETLLFFCLFALHASSGVCVCVRACVCVDGERRRQVEGGVQQRM